jgi:mono/diheme cytochrome c family protein
MMKRNRTWTGPTGTNRRWARQARTASLTLVALAGSVAVSAGQPAETALARGNYLVNSILGCGNCHTPKDAEGKPIAGKELAGGGLTIATPGFTATGSNLTPDRETGIGSWSDAEIKRALTEGIRPGHSPLANAKLVPVMPVPYYKALTAGDLDAVVAYLRSLPAVRNTVPAPVYKVPISYEPYPGAAKPYTDDAMRDPVQRGAYLAAIGHCMECHTPFTKDAPVPDYRNSFGKGERQFGPPVDSGFPASWKGSLSRNITSHRTAGIGAWSDEEIKRAISKGIGRDGRQLQPPMPYLWYARMNDADLSAIVAWLRTLPPLQ